jgi:hypothetical protein
MALKARKPLTGEAPVAYDTTRRAYMNEPWKFDLQLFTAGAPADDETTLDGDPDPDDRTAETPEQELERLRRESGEKDQKLTTFQGVIDELHKRPPTERIIEREVQRGGGEQQLSNEELQQREARLALQLGTEPGKVLTQLKNEAKREAVGEIMNEFGDTAADTVIDRFVKKARSRDPVVADKVEEIFRGKVDKMPARGKAALLRTPAADREELMWETWNASAGDYLLPKARARVKPGQPTDAGGRTAASNPDLPTRDEKFTFSASQKEAMRRAGMDDKTIAAREKAVAAGVM